MRCKELRLYLKPEHWEVFDKVCEKREVYRGRLASEIVAAWCVERIALNENYESAMAANDATRQMMREAGL